MTVVSIETKAMKFIFTSSIIICLFISCSKETTRVTDDITGKWKAKQQFRSPGAGGTWYPLDNADQFVIEFKNDGSFTYSPNFPKAGLSFNKYDTINRQVNISSSNNSNTESWYYTLENKQTLNLSIYQCFEGCPYRLIAIE